MVWGSTGFRRVALAAVRTSGFHRLAELRTGGIGVILRIRRVRPRAAGHAGLLAAHEISPVFLDRALRMVRRHFDVVSLDDMARALGQGSRRRRRFACITLDGAWRDTFLHAAPVLRRHDVPYALYVPSGFPDGLSHPWWLALEETILRHDRIGLFMDGKERRFDCLGRGDKQFLFDELHRWLRALPHVERDAAVADICVRYKVDLRLMSLRAMMSWDDISLLAADPLVTIGTATVSHVPLSDLNEAAARREMKMGQAVTEGALGLKPVHFAYPFGEAASFGRRDMMLAEELGFATAVTCEPRVVRASDSAFALPRITLDGGMQSVAALRVVLSGLAAPMPAL